MGSMTDYTENKMLELIVGKTAFTLPAACVGLSTTTITDAGGNITEPNSNAGYARNVTSGGAWSAGSGGTITNVVTVPFAVANSAWGAITDFTLCDSLALGNVTMYGALTASKTIAVGDNCAFAPGALVFTLG